MFQNDVLATFTIRFQDVECRPATPVAPTVTDASCVNGEVTVPTLELATTEGITYTASPGAPYSPGQSVTVTATLADGFEWGQLTRSWTELTPTTATYVVTFAPATCTEVVPTLPTATEAVCAGGVVVPPSLELADTDGITYTADPGPPYLGGQEVTVTATLDDTGVAWPPTLPAGWLRTNSTTAVHILTFGVASCVPASPAGPTVTQATCSAGAVTDPDVVVATEPAGVSYTVSPPPPYDGDVDNTVVVTATLIDGFEWGQLPDGWVIVDPTTATYTAELALATCEIVSPVAPAIEQAVCADGVVSPPHVGVPVTDGITYRIEPDRALQPGDPFVITATLDDTGVAWPDPLPPGWVQTSPTTATYSGTLEDVACVPVAPVAPTVTQATCANGVVTTPSVVLATVPTGVAYSAEPPGPYNGTVDTPVTVTALLADGYEWGQLATGWIEVDPQHATYAVALAAASCDEVTPAAPAVTEAVCAGGVLVPPSIVLATTDNITYVASPGGPYAPGQQVVVTATLAPTAVGWPQTLPTGWTKTSSTTATYTVTFAEVACTPAVPVAPTVTQPTCSGGVVTTPTIVLATTPAGVSYASSPAGPYDGTVDTPVTVTATLADGFEWGPLPDGWVEVDPVTATYPVTLVGTTCDEVTPVLPTVTQAVCAAGVLTPPSLVLSSTDGITYSADPAGPYAPGQPVIVTATLDDAGVGWPDPLPDGWIRTGDTTATYTFTFDDVSCTPVAPVAPTVVAATCVAGDLTPPTVTLAVTPGVTYVADPPGPYDPSMDTDIVVTATLADGFEWDTGGPATFGFRTAAAPQQAVPAGWTIVDPTTATFAISLPAFPPCPLMTPVEPTVSDPTCADGVASTPTLAFATTEGIAYSADPAGPYEPGQPVVVTASITDDAAGWSDPLPAGWTIVDPRTATFALTFADPDCTLPTTTASPTTPTTPCPRRPRCQWCSHVPAPARCRANCCSGRWPPRQARCWCSPPDVAGSAANRTVNASPHLYDAETAIRSPTASNMRTWVTGLARPDPPQVGGPTGDQ